MAEAKPINYANYLEINSLAGAVIFAVLYFPLLVFFLMKAISRPTYVYIILTLFATVRFTAFILRAILTRVYAEQINQSFFLAYEIIYNVGFFGLLYSAYTLAADRAAFSQSGGIISKIIQLRFIFRLALSAAVAIGITGAVESFSDNAKTASTGNTLRKVGIYIFLICAIIVLLQTIYLSFSEASHGGYRKSGEGFGASHGAFILMFVAALLVLREAFFTGTSNNPTEQNKETIWFPLSALTEFLAVLCFTTPGLVPARSEIPQEKV
ncbi:hypothetical protein BJ138DRAFT_1080382 [Hygrophoropsis aurantiaca]|uniref:Uncharacterized protein n=1 Tax=Hygrophoropsis aurantiaca TaxID=72124 RepID=A0ACB8AKT8_9AGAM|nr:hypothetical protein BJ138DRAFT_1080382 [Hygrophoropsis aurantiaca]